MVLSLPLLVGGRLRVRPTVAHKRRFAHSGKFQKLFNDRGEIISNLGYSTSYLRNQKQQCRNRPQKFTIDIPSINPPRKLMEEYWFLAPMLRFAISSALLKHFFSETLHDNLPVVWAKGLSRSTKKTTSCKKATELPG